jgi:hypothetical protein
MRILPKSKRAILHLIFAIAGLRLDSQFFYKTMETLTLDTVGGHNE